VPSLAAPRADDSPKVSLIVVNYNGMGYLRDCIESLLNTNYERFEIIIVDNASTDRSIDSISTLIQDPRVRVLRLARNLGYAGACNLGSQSASGGILAFLNVDIVVTPNWLQPLISVFLQDPSVGAAQPRLVMQDDSGVQDAAGGYIDIFGCAHERQFASPGAVQNEILYAKGAAILIPSSLFSRLDSFDDDFQFYYEETDLCWRVWLSGHRVVYVSDSVVFHARAGITRSLDANRKAELYMMARLDRLRMILKNYEYMYLFTLMPIIMLNNLKDILILLVLGASHSALWATIKVPVRALTELKRTLRKRYLARQYAKIPNRVLIGLGLIVLTNPFFVPHEIGDLPLKRRYLINHWKKHERWRVPSR
jgi:GT2 family glycosyltransferase